MYTPIGFRDVVLIFRFRVWLGCMYVLRTYLNGQVQDDWISHCVTLVLLSAILYLLPETNIGNGMCVHMIAHFFTSFLYFICWLVAKGIVILSFLKVILSHCLCYNRSLFLSSFPLFSTEKAVYGLH